MVNDVVDRTARTTMTAYTLGVDAIQYCIADRLQFARVSRRRLVDSEFKLRSSAKPTFPTIDRHPDDMATSTAND